VEKEEEEEEESVAGGKRVLAGTLWKPARLHVNHYYYYYTTNLSLQWWQGNWRRTVV